MVRRPSTPAKPNQRLAAVVTGGVNGIGEAIAKRLALLGHPLAIVDYDARGCRRMERWARERRRPFLALPHDISD